MTREELYAYVRAEAARGVDWMGVTADDVVQAFCEERCEDFDVDAIEAAHREGAREWRASRGWVERWTTAPTDYDSFGTETIAAEGEWHGKTLRRVLIDPVHRCYQESRYGSGLHPSWIRDPRVEEAEIAARVEAIRQDEERRASRRAEGLAWLRAVEDADALDWEDVEARGLAASDLREERERRRLEREQAARDAEWERCTALVPEGCTLVDDGAPATRGQWGVISGRPSRVYYRVTVEQWTGDAERADVRGEGGDVVGSLAYVADWVASGRLRVVAESDVPPRAVLHRVGNDRLRDIRRVEVGEVVVWVCRDRWGSTFADDALVLDARGHKVRSRSIRAAALNRASRGT